MSLQKWMVKKWMSTHNIVTFQNLKHPERNLKAARENLQVTLERQSSDNGAVPSESWGEVNCNQPKIPYSAKLSISCDCRIKFLGVWHLKKCVLSLRTLLGERAPLERGISSMLHMKVINPECSHHKEKHFFLFLLLYMRGWMFTKLVVIVSWCM